jgi:hypothetical protein
MLDVAPVFGHSTDATCVRPLAGDVILDFPATRIALPPIHETEQVTRLASKEKVAAKLWY